MKHIRVKKAIMEFLFTHPGSSTTEIKEYINDRFKHGVTSHMLINILGRDRKSFLRGDYTRESSVTYEIGSTTGFRCRTWSLKEE